MFEHKQKWQLNLQSTEPISKQLEQNIRWSISTGDIARQERLPPIRTLAADLGISPNTVRRVYKNLEKDGYLVTRPHYGTYVLSVEENLDESTAEFKRAIRNVLRSALSPEAVREIFDYTFTEYLNSIEHKPILFVETDPITINNLQSEIAMATGYEVQGMLMEDFFDFVKKTPEGLDHYSAIVTTYFHFYKLRNTKGVYAPMVCGMVQNIQDNLQEALSVLQKGAKVGLFCRKSEPVLALQNLILSLREDINLEIYFDDTPDCAFVCSEKSIIICSSPGTAKLLYPIIGQEVPVYELLNGINSQSMNMLVDFLK